MRPMCGLSYKELKLKFYVGELNAMISLSFALILTFDGSCIGSKGWTNKLRSSHTNRWLVGLLSVKKKNKFVNNRN